MPGLLGVKVAVQVMEAWCHPAHKHLAGVLAREDPHGVEVLINVLSPGIHFQQVLLIKVRVRPITAKVTAATTTHGPHGVLELEGNNRPGSVNAQDRSTGSAIAVTFITDPGDGQGAGSVGGSRTA